MNTYPLDSVVRQMATTSIAAYQQYISPHKGFACAHRLLKGGESCCEYIKQAIAQEGFLAALAISRQRFAACREANQILKARYRSISSHDDPDSKREKSKNRSNDCADACPDCAGVGCETLDCTSGLDCGTVDCAHCGSGVDCGGADCGSGLDCATIDCGSCGS